MPRKKPETKWRNSQQLRGVLSQLTVAINTSNDGAYAMLDLKSARNLQEVCRQAIHTEIGHEPTQQELHEMATLLRRQELWEKRK